jgi:plastocyanin
MRKLLLVAVVGAAFVAAGPADGRTWIVWAGAPANPPADLATSDPWLNQFLPKTTTIRVGDRITFKSREIHTATFLGSAPLSQFPILMPDPASHYSGIVDSLGMPFWFNGGPPKFIYNPDAWLAVGSARVADKAAHSSPNLALTPSHQYTFTFPKAGTYKLICLVHPTVMKGTVVVKAKKAKVLTKAKFAATTLKQLNQYWTQSRALLAQAPPSTPNTVYAGIGKAPTLQAFKPRSLTVPVGTTVTWANNAPGEPHNMAFGDLSYQEALLQATDLFPTSRDSPNQVTPFVVFGSEPPGPYVYTGSNHGNGFLATPVIDQDPATPNPPSFAVTFTKAGSYHYMCQIHGKDMAGDIVVTG